MTGYKTRLAELLGNLQEECAEVIKDASKINRFEASKEKLQNLGEEVGDTVAMVEFLVQEGYITIESIEKGYKRKRKKMTDSDHMTYLKDSKNEQGSET